MGYHENIINGLTTENRKQNDEIEFWKQKFYKMEAESEKNAEKHDHLVNWIKIKETRAMEKDKREQLLIADEIRNRAFSAGFETNNNTPIKVGTLKKERGKSFKRSLSKVFKRQDI